MSVFEATVAAFFAAALFIVPLALIASVRGGASGDTVTAFGCQAAAYLVALFLVLRRYAPDASIRQFLALRPTHGGFYALGLLLGLALPLPANALYSLIERSFPSSHPDALALLYAGSSSLKRLVLALVIIAFGPLIEEIFFRGALFRPMRAGHSAPLVVATTAVLFAVAHVEPRMMLPIAAVGVVLGLLRWFSGSLAPSLFAHAAFNAVGFYSIVTASDEAPRWPLVLASSVAVALLVAGAVVLGRRSSTARHAQLQDSI